jgi:multicomponent Na+:H+ antiporter subunit D
MGATNALVPLLVLVPLATGLVCVPLVNRRGLCRAIGVIGMLSTLVLALVQLAGGGVRAVQMGDWAAPYGITLVFDPLSGLMVSAAAAVALGSVVAAFGSLPATTERRYFHPLVHFMMMGVYLSFLTGDLFNLFVAFEVMLMASYGLLVIGKSRAQMSHAYKYVLMNLLASSVFVIAAGMTYGMFGTLNLADLSRLATQQAAAGTLPVGFAALGLLFLFVFALKAGVFPLWFWLPDTYPTMPIAVTALFGGVLTKVGLYAIARTFPMIFLQGEAADVLLPILGVTAALTMFVGVLGALAYRGLRRAACMLLIVGVGYALLGIAAASPGALTGSAFYMTQSMLVMAGLFLCIGLIEQREGTDQTGRLGALLQKPGSVGLGVMVFVLLLSVVGLPPTSGFYGKLLVIRESLTAGLWPAGVTGLVVGGLTLLACLRLWGSSFYGPPPEGVKAKHGAAAGGAPETKGPGFTQWLGAGGLVVASLAVGFVAEPVMVRSAEAGRLLTVDQSIYRDAVLHHPRYTAVAPPSPRGAAAPAVDSNEPPPDDASRSHRHD